MTCRSEMGGIYTDGATFYSLLSSVYFIQTDQCKSHPYPNNPNSVEATYLIKLPFPHLPDRPSFHTTFVHVHPHVFRCPSIPIYSIKNVPSLLRRLHQQSVVHVHVSDQQLIVRRPRWPNPVQALRRCRPQDC